VRELIQATGARLLYLPPYSPDFNPIEKCWAQLKQHLRAVTPNYLLFKMASRAISRPVARGVVLRSVLCSKKAKKGQTALSPLAKPLPKELIPGTPVAVDRVVCPFFSESDRAEKALR